MYITQLTQSKTACVVAMFRNQENNTEELISLQEPEHSS